LHPHPHPYAMHRATHHWAGRPFVALEGTIKFTHPHPHSHPYAMLKVTHHWAGWPFVALEGIREGTPR